MINRLKQYHEQLKERPEEDYFVVACEFDEFYVTAEVAEAILEALEGRTPPRWIRFRDVYGSKVSVRGGEVDHVREWTVSQRASARAFRRARQREEKADRRPWEDDE